MKYQCFIIAVLLVVLSCKIPVNGDIIPFTATDMHKMIRMSQLTMDNAKEYAVYTLTQWNPTTKKMESMIQSKHLVDEKKIDSITEFSSVTRDSSPIFSKISPELLFLRTENGKTHVRKAVFPKKNFEDTFDQVTSYPIDVSNIYTVEDNLIFSAEVYVNCQTLQCTADKDAEVQKRGANTWSTFDSLMVRHWDTWYTQGKASHVFLQKIQNGSNGIEVLGDPIDLLQDQMVSSPPIETGAEQFSVSSDGKYIAFSGLKRNHDEAWNTKWNIYLYNVETKKTEIITDIPDYVGRCQNPMFSPDGSKLAFFSMKREGLESDQFYLNVYDLKEKTFVKPATQNNFKPYLNQYTWKDETHFLLSTIDTGKSVLYEFDYMATDDSKAYIKMTDDTNAYDIPVLTDVEDIYLIAHSSFTSPTVLAQLDFTDKQKKAVVTTLLDFNEEALLKFVLDDGESFMFKSDNGDDVQGWIMKPSNFDENSKYPLAFLIHGGPEGAWEPSWSYRWNPQVWAHAGYVVVMVNPHGSSGMGIDFQDAVRNDWGGLPYRDLMGGVDYVLEKYKFIDPNRLGACGASYGGFMVNWIQGNTDRFKGLVTHDGVFSTVTMFYGTEEMWFPLSEYCPRDQLGCKPYESEEAREGYEKFSPELKANNWKTPHLIIHGTKDYRIPVTEGISAFTALQLKNIPSRFVHFPDENHWVLKSENSIEWYKEVIGWLDKYVKK